MTANAGRSLLISSRYNTANSEGIERRIEWSPSSLLLHSRVASRDRFARLCHPHFLARHIHVTSLARDRRSAVSRPPPCRVFVKTPLFASRSSILARSIVLASRYLRVTRDTSSSSSLGEKARVAAASTSSRRDALLVVVARREAHRRRALFYL